MNVVLLAEELAMSIKKASREKGWWHILPLNSNTKATETDCAMSSIGKLFALPNIAVRVIFKAVNLFKEKQKGTHVISNNGVDDFKAKCGFDNGHLEMSIVCLIDQRSCYVKLGYCDENLRIIWRKHKKGDASVIVPRTLGRTERALKFMSVAIKKTFKHI